MPSLLFWLLVIAFVLTVLPSSAYAFGAGNLPSYGYLENKAFRHGDIEDVLAELLKRTGSGLLKQGSKFKGLDIKRVYFGNWLRDYSQAVDVAGLKATSIQNILTICTVLGFLAHGFVTDEFEVTEERLGVYLPIEHIDNPKGYPEDARNFHPRLRGPVDPRELEIDLRTGMKNYIANEDGGWDTSKALVRKRLQECIQIGRRYRSTGNKAEQYEAFRLLGTALHTIEDFPAHSNFCELALVSMGHPQVFTHVGDNVRIRAPNGRVVAPLVTGTFGGDDFQHSLLGEAGDHISQSSISDLNDKMNNAKIKSSSGDFGSANKIKSLINSLPLGSLGNSSDGASMSRDMDAMQAKRAGPGKDPSQMTPKELYQNIWAILSFRDSVVKKISYGIEKIPGLGPLIDSIIENLTVWVFQTLEPYLKPLMQTATTQLASSSAAVINKLDQYEVFHEPNASDPTHSILSKDHFNLILNEPAGNLAKIIVIYTVKLVVHAWDHAEDNANQVVETVLECLFHPDFHNPHSNIQKEMMTYMRTWVDAHSAGQYSIISRLTKEAVRNHQNIRQTGDSSIDTVSASTHGQGAKLSHGHGASGKMSSAMGGMPGMSQMQNFMGHVHMPGSHGGGYGSREFPDPSQQPPHGSGGYQSPSGPPGYAQTSGYPGASSHQGYSGSTPSSGYQAPSGYPGSTPSSGYQAPSGYPGSLSPPGASGYPQGSPGFPGAPSQPSYGQQQQYGAPAFPSQPPGGYGAPGGAPPPMPYGQPQYGAQASPPGPPGFPGGPNMPAFPGGPQQPGYPGQGAPQYGGQPQYPPQW
ncbi:hypothetical protein FRC14_002488 [Serendipita sp. 396]|nr:hypothetical protein FRC14_002488 [Serendipita sp. 396]